MMAHQQTPCILPAGGWQEDCSISRIPILFLLTKMRTDLLHIQNVPYFLQPVHLEALILVLASTQDARELI